MNSDRTAVPSEFIPDEPMILGNADGPVCTVCSSTVDHGDLNENGEWECIWCCGYLSHDYRIEQFPWGYIVYIERDTAPLACVTPHGEGSYSVDPGPAWDPDQPPTARQSAIVDRRENHCSVCSSRTGRCKHLRKADLVQWNQKDRP